MLLTAQTSRENVSQNKCVWTTLSEFHLVCIQLDGIYVGSVTRAKVDKDVRVRVLEFEVVVRTPRTQSTATQHHPFHSVHRFICLSLPPSHWHAPFSLLAPVEAHAYTTIAAAAAADFFETNIRKNQTNSTKMNGIEKEVRKRSE